MGLEPGTILGSFEITGLIGKGGMGEVYRALDMKLERYVAIKVLPDSVAGDSHRLARFEREAKILASLNHPHIAALYELGEDGGTRFLVMELVDGETLENRILKGPVPIGEALPLFTQIAQALDAAHEKGIVHRDLKPANIMITQDGRPKVLDFGLAASLSSTTTASPGDLTTPGTPPTTKVTADGAILGTPSYMSPEQARGKPLEKRTDIWSFGCCMFEALAGCSPFQAETTADMLAAVIAGEPDWQALPVDLPGEFLPLLQRCLEKEEKRRFSSAGDIAITLENVSEELSPRASGSRSGLSAISASPPTDAAFPRFAKPLVAVAAVALVVASALYWGRRSNETVETTDTALMPGARAYNSLAVLPFKNLSGDDDQKYAAEAFTDILTAKLARIASITVISNVSTRSYKDTIKPIREIAQELGADAIVTGSWISGSDPASITVQLVDGQTEKLFWSDAAEGGTADILQFQSDVAFEIAKQIGATLTADERTRMGPSKGTNSEAYDAFTIGHYLLNQATEESLRDSISHFEEAIRLDPNFAHGYGGLVCAYTAFPVYGISKPRDFYPLARDAGIQALRLNRNLAGDQSHMGFISMAYYWEWDLAERQFLRAQELSPNGSIAYVDYAVFLALVGRSKEAQEVAATARVVEPNPDASIIKLWLSLAYLEDDPKKTLDNLLRLNEERPQFYPALEGLALAYKYLGQFNEAVSTAQRWVDSVGEDGPAIVALARAHADAGNEEEARAVLEGLDEIDDYVDSARAAYAYVALGDFDTAFEWLRNGLLQRDYGMVELLTIPYWKPYIDQPNWIRFRDDPLYRDLIDRVDFPPLPSGHPGYEDDSAWRSR